MSPESLRKIDVPPFIGTPTPKVEDLHDKANQILDIYGTSSIVSHDGTQFKRKNLFVPLSSSLTDRLVSTAIGLASTEINNDLSLKPNQIYFIALDEKFDFRNKKYTNVVLDSGKNLNVVKPYSRTIDIEIFESTRGMRALRPSYNSNVDLVPQELRGLDSMLDFIALAAEQYKTTSSKSLEQT